MTLWLVQDVIGDTHQLVLIVIHMAKRVHHGWRIEPLLQVETRKSEKEKEKNTKSVLEEEVTANLLGNFAVAVGVNVFEMAMEAVMVTINHTFFTL